MKKNKPYIAHIVSHTHWDRAWYLPFEKFRFKLTEMISHLLKVLEKKEDFKHFVFDGQMVPIEDYLEIFPQDYKRIEKMVKSGKLVIGPSYVLPDEYIVSAESLIRNLLIGIREAKKFGNPMMVGYYPDPFGHVSQMPMILNGFGIKSFLFMRGMGDEAEDIGVEFIWQASDGESQVVASQSHYGSARALGYPFKVQTFYKADPEIAFKSAVELFNERKKAQKTQALLFYNGIDHYHADEDLGKMIEYINKNTKEFKLVHSTFDKYLKDFLSQKPSLKKYKGEIHSGKHDWILSGVFSSRMYLKQMNESAETLLERLVEPLSTFGYFIDGDYPKEFMNYAWMTLLKNHPHDDICGCSVDAVHRDMVSRFEHVEQVGDMLLDRMRNKVLFGIDYKRDTHKEFPIIAMNTLASERIAPVSIDLILPEKEVADKKLCVEDSEGNVVPSVIDAGTKHNEPWLYDEETPLRKVKIEFLTNKLPQLGYKTFYICEDKDQAASKKKSDAPQVKLIKNGMENEFNRLTFNKNGSFNLSCKTTGATYKNLNYFEDEGDRGDEYDFSQIAGEKPIDTKKIDAEISVSKVTPFSITYKSLINFPIPERLAEDRNYRSKNLLVAKITTETTLYAGIPYVEIRTEIDNPSREHRLRAVFPTIIKTDHISVESKFDVIKRPLRYEVVKTWAQPNVQTHHQDHFASLSDGKSGITFFNFGLPEYETTIEKDGVAYHQTLFRSVSWLSRHDLLTRSNNAGPPIYAPEAEMLGKSAFKYAVMTHRGDWEKADAHIQAYSFNTRVEAMGFNHKFHKATGKQSLPEEFSFIKVNPAGIIVSACKAAEDASGIIVRLYNPYSETKSVSVSFSKPVAKATMTDLNEDDIRSLNVDKQNSVTFSLKNKKIQTIKIRLKK